MAADAVSRRIWLVRAGLLLSVVLLVGSGLLWWLGSRHQIRQVPIQVVRGLSPSELSVQFEVGYPGCSDPLEVQVEESSDRVELTARTISPGLRPFETLECPASARVIVRTVRLEQPLAGRRVIDAARDQVIEPAT